MTRTLIALALMFCASAFGADYNFTLPQGCTVNGSSSISGHCDSVAPPTPGAIACTTGTPSDVAGYKAICAGTYLLHSTSGANVPRGPAAYSFKFVFGNGVGDWPNVSQNTSEIFTVGRDQYLSIPFTPTPGATLLVSEAQSFTPHPISISVSTVPGLFGNNHAGGSVICVAGNRGLPSLVLSSNGLNPQAQCKLNPAQQYWLNVIPATFNPNTNTWGSDFTGNAQMAVTVGRQN